MASSSIRALPGPRMRASIRTAPGPRARSSIRTLPGPRMRRALAALALVVSICGCEFAGARINVYNRSDETLTAIELTGSGFSAAVDSLPPGGTASVRVNPDGESALSVAFTASGERHTIEEQGAFDGRAHYQVRVEVKPDLSVSVREFLK